MARLYSEKLWSEPTMPGGAYTSPVVPAGFVWIVREVEVFGQGDLNWRTAGFTLTSIDGAPIFAISYPFAEIDRFYHLTTRQVLDAGDQLVMVTGEYGWSWRISGYALSTP